MKPELLQMEGFAPFRSKTVVDFSGLELFALTGPTGAGKSSVIDAITFALYGSVPRHNRRAVEPIITLGAAEARVLFDFEVEGRSYRAARLVRRTTRGGAAGEARLESGGEVLASGGPQVTQRVEELLGLNIEHFTRSVVLPQGEFAAFLHDPPASQQALVKALLDMGILDSVRRLSAERAKTSAAVADSARNRLDHLADATEEAEETAARRLERLKDLVKPVAAAEKRIVELKAAAQQKSDSVKELREQVELLGAIDIPPDLADLAASLDEAGAELAEAEAAAAVAVEAHESLVEQSEDLPGRDALEEIARMWGRLGEERAAVAGMDLASVERVVTQTESDLAKAKEEQAKAVEAWEEARSRHAAHVLTMGLSEGDPCPVCAQPLESDPEPPPADLEERRQAASLAETAVESARKSHQDAQRAAVEARARHEAGAKTISDLEGRLVDKPSEAELDDLIANRREIDGKLDEARKAVKAGRDDESSARAKLKALDTATREAWECFSDARDKVATLSPPATGRQDLRSAWEALATWAKEESGRLGEAISTTEAEAEEAAGALEREQVAVGAWLTEADVGGSGPPSVRLAAAVATAEGELERIQERRKEREGLEADIDRFGENAAVATTLSNHLKANRFEGWLLAEALATLVMGANSLLDGLTKGTYSLALAERTIEVVDHRNADEHRSVQSLSGGETFLVSLALALSLGEQLTNLSERGGARLEAIFLDEGFGTLDAETLETVSVVVTELAARGRMVGVVTHVKDLAEQIPVRFEVRPGASGSTIERVET